jgi:hypothetical protein
MVDARTLDAAVRRPSPWPGSPEFAVPRSDGMKLCFLWELFEFRLLAARLALDPAVPG